jgi:hypothetical protein
MPCHKENVVVAEGQQRPLNGISAGLGDVKEQEVMRCE